MFNYLGRTLNKQLKFYKSHSLCDQKLFSAFYPINYPICVKTNHDKFKTEKANDSLKLQTRQFSLKEGEQFFIKYYYLITNSEASKFVKETLIEIHDFSGLPWWATIVVCTATLKLLIGFPISVFQHYVIAKLKLSNVELQNVAKDIKEKVLLDARRGKWSVHRQNMRLSVEMRKQWKVIVVKNNCHPFKTVILNLIQIPIWVLTSLTLRRLASDAVSGNLDSIQAAMQLMIGGVFWSPNLTLPDSSIILPTLIFVTSLAIIELNYLTTKGFSSFYSKVLINFFRLLSIFSFFISSNMPSCVCVYWATSLLCGLVINLLILSPKIRRFFKIPITSLESQNPYRYVVTTFIENLKKFGRLFPKK